MSAAWLLFFSVIPTIIIPTTYAELRERSIFDRSSVSERTMKSILESCYDYESSSDAIVLVGDFNEFTDKLPMIRMNNFKNFCTDSLPYFKPTRVIVIIDSSYELEAKIKSLKGMKWWNYLASFFVIGTIDKMAFRPLRQEYLQMPVVTRAYTTACVLTTLAVQLELVSPFQLYFNPILIIQQYQFWRLITTFLYFGTVGFNFFFNMIFTYRYCRMLEEGPFRGKTADFVMMFIFGAVCMIGFAFFVNLLFLGHAFTLMLVYVWSRRTPFVRMNFFGLLNFNAPLLPWVLLGFSVLLGNVIWVDLIGMAVGHMYYFAEDVFPNQRGGFRILKTPQILKKLFDEHPVDPNYAPLPEDRPGGFAWGQDADVQ